MFSMAVSPWIVNNMLWIFQEKGLFSYTVHSDEVPAEAPLKLRTNDFLLIAPGLVLQLGQDMALTIASSSAPVLSLKDDGTIGISVPTKLGFDVIQPNGSRRFAFTIDSPVEISVSIAVEEGTPQVLTAKLALLSVTPLSVGESAVGPLNCCVVHTIGSLLQCLTNAVVLPNINRHLEKGAPLPAILCNTRVDTWDDAFRVYSDIR